MDKNALLRMTIPSLMKTSIAVQINVLGFPTHQERDAGYTDVEGKKIMGIVRIFYFITVIYVTCTYTLLIISNFLSNTSKLMQNTFHISKRSRRLFGNGLGQG